MDRLGGSFGSHDAEDHYDDFGPEHAAPETPPSPVGQDERRMQVRAYNHWASLLGERNYPHIDDLTPETLDDFGPYSVVLDFSAGIDDPGVRFLGAMLATECAAQASIHQLSDVPSRSLLSRITDHYMQILANQAPIGFEAEFVNQRGIAVLYRGILLPYSSDDATIDFIYGVINWKEVADQATADELLLEIDQALGAYHAAGEEDAVGDRAIETAETLTARVASDRDDAVLELGNAEMIEDNHAERLPQPAFGREREDDEMAQARDVAHAGEAPRPGRALDALGNPLGAGVTISEHEDYYCAPVDDEGSGYFDSTMKTAADYGLPDWDDEEDEGEDVDDVVDPLAEDAVTSSLTSLVSRGLRSKKSVDLTAPSVSPPVPQAYEGDPVILHAFEAEFGTDAAEPGFAAEPAALAPAAEERFDEALAPVLDAPSPEGLYDCLAAAREMAQTALTTEDRSRKALYAAVGRAYDFSLEAEASPDDYADLIADNGLTVQDRAPMTPIVKLVFGADYDKTRLTEYAAVLMHAHRVGVERGALTTYLRSAEGGLKGILNAERRARKEEQGKPVEDAAGVRSALAKKLRKIEPIAFADIDENGAEFALVMVRRTPAGELIVLGEVPEDVPLLEKAARKLLG